MPQFSITDRTNGKTLNVDLPRAPQNEGEILYILSHPQNMGPANMRPPAPPPQMPQQMPPMASHAAPPQMPALPAMPSHQQKSGLLPPRFRAVVPYTDRDASLFQRLGQPGEGVTIHAVTNEEPKGPGYYAVSPHKDRERVFPKAKSFTHDDMLDFVVDNYDLLVKDGNYLGLWHNPKTGELVADVSVVVKSKDEARRLAILHKQDAYFDFGTRQTKYIDDDDQKAVAAIAKKLKAEGLVK